MNYIALAYVHLFTVLPAFFIGIYLLINPKGTQAHKMLGRVYMALLLFTSIVSLFMSAKVGPTLFDHFGYIHLLSVFTIYSILIALWCARHGHIRAHKFNMVGVYLGGVILAGALALTPGRLMHGWLF
ncbi:DUF2306 domain-containing protein [Vibrio sp. SM6]|uniref:DUF2306 domain-containing protein n=1 Tax=Vibrio agarilyticus TaxID=2726741 RepID=A0A7X8YGQ3_9VIBR|nr:DUF2306 domain-containing protein [Vibrio agarilyticus]NLS12607.1 DUF2306 domain-containing protein [Vibrio agarilyticus]